MRAIVLSALLLSGCNQGADDRICASAPMEIAKGDMPACVHKWAYRLAGSPDAAAVVAKAVTQACVNVIGEDAERSATQIAGHPDEARRQEMFSRSMEVMEGQALFRVVQARAGHCKIV